MKDSSIFELIIPLCIFVFWFLVSIIKSASKKDDEKQKKQKVSPYGNNDDYFPPLSNSERLNRHYSQSAAQQRNGVYIPQEEILPVPTPQSGRLRSTTIPQMQAKPLIEGLPEEGERVTTGRPEVYADHMPLRHPALHNKENLKRALIFGEILAPKF